MDINHQDIIYLKELGKPKKKTVDILTCVDLFVSLAGAGTVMPGKKEILFYQYIISQQKDGI